MCYSAVLFDKAPFLHFCPVLMPWSPSFFVWLQLVLLIILSSHPRVPVHELLNCCLSVALCNICVWICLCAASNMFASWSLFHFEVQIAVTLLEKSMDTQRWWLKLNSHLLESYGTILPSLHMPLIRWALEFFFHL